MSAFPILVTGAPAQYPLKVRYEWPSRVLRFVDGREQRFASGRGPQKRWRIQLEYLTDGEANRLCRFFMNRRGKHEAFSFFDPSSNEEMSECYFGADALVIRWTGFHGFSSEVEIEQKLK